MIAVSNSSKCVVAAMLFSGTLILACAGCQSRNPTNANAASLRQRMKGSQAGQPGVGQEVFPSDDAAAAALLAAVKTQNHAKLHLIFGPAMKTLVSGDKVEDDRHFEEFVAHAKQKFWLEKKNADTSIVHIGNKNWPFPIPIVRLANDKWFFDTEAGKAEILARRIGADELDTIEVCEAYVRAQQQYAATYHDGADVLRYAQRLVSKPGTQDGLYWAAAVGQPESPFGPLAAQAAAEGYTPGAHKTAGPHPFNGYYFHILTRQGSAAPGGKYNYVINGNMIAGFALVAFPAKYGSSGIMTFVVNQQGRVYQKDLGRDTLSIARHMTRYNPGKSWTLIQE